LWSMARNCALSPIRSTLAIVYSLFRPKFPTGIPSLSAIKPDLPGQNNWTKVSTILWYRSNQYQGLIDIGFVQAHAVPGGCRENAALSGRFIIRRGINREEDRGANLPCRLRTWRYTS